MDAAELEMTPDLSARAPATTPATTGRTRELVILNAIAEALNRAPDVRQALEATLGLVTELLGLKTGWIWLLDEATDQFYSAAVRNLPPYLQEPVRMRGGADCWCIDDFRAGKLTPRNIGVLECSRLRTAFLGADAEAARGLRYHASVPLYFGGKPLGILNVTGPAWRQLTRAELRLLSTIAYQVGIAVERARLAEAGTRLARVEERARIAREIHDTLAQGLTAIALQLEAALNQLERDPARARERLERALTTARENLEEARRSVVGLRAAPLDGKPLPEALRALARAFTADTGVRVHVRVTGQGTVPPRVEAELYRIAQEALANVRKWAEAREVDIRLTIRPETAALTVRDDGRGLRRVTGDAPAVTGDEEPQSAPSPVTRQSSPASGGHGIVGMRERARALGGRLSVTSRPGRGTRVHVTVPLPTETPP